MSEVRKCIAITEHGAMCSRDAMKGSNYCWQHKDVELIENEKLTPKQKRFCEEYIVDLNATRAAKAAGFSGNRAGELGYQLLQKPTVRKEIERLMKARSLRTQITADRVLQELAILAYSDIKDFVNIVEKDGQKYADVKTTAEMNPLATRAISEIKQTKHGITIKLHNKPKALEDIGRHLGMWNDKLEITHGQKLEDFFDKQ